MHKNRRRYLLRWMDSQRSRDRLQEPYHPHQHPALECDDLQPCSTPGSGSYVHTVGADSEAAGSGKIIRAPLV